MSRGLRSSDFLPAMGFLAIRPPRCEIPSHRHDFAGLSLYLAGNCIDRGETGDIGINGPAAVFHAPGTAHAGVVGLVGVEVVGIDFDPRWITAGGCEMPADGRRFWTGGPVAGAARALALSWVSAEHPSQLVDTTLEFVRRALALPAQGSPPTWLLRIRDQVLFSEPDAGEVRRLIRKLGLNAAWVAETYRAEFGEGIRDTLRRRRIENAAVMLRSTASPIAQIAAENGFCDQSHMNRAFRTLLGRTPTAIRTEGNERKEFYFSNLRNVQAAQTALN